MTELLDAKSDSHEAGSDSDLLTDSMDIFNEVNSVSKAQPGYCYTANILAVMLRSSGSCGIQQ